MALSLKRLHCPRDGAYAMHEAIWTLHFRLGRNDISYGESSLSRRPLIPAIDCGNLGFSFCWNFLCWRVDGD